MPRRVIHYNWIFQTINTGVWGNFESTPKQKRIQQAVTAELDKLSFEEREFIDLYWIRGYSIQELGQLLGVKPYKMEGLNKSILRKLKNRLTDFVREEFGPDVCERDRCLICDHLRRDEIDILLKTKKTEETYQRIITVLKNDFQLIIKTPQIIVGHIKYHTKEK
jgi:hypothetical protein